MIETGLCSSCHKVAPVVGKKKCASCAAARREYYKKWSEGKDSEYWEQERSKERDRHRKRVEAGLVKTRSQRSAERKAVSICVCCGVVDRPIEDGLVTCNVCREKYRQWRVTNRGKASTKTRNKRRDPERLKELNRKYTRQLKRMIIDLYGGSCRCCGIEQIEFLTIDHINNDGTKDRQKMKTGSGGTRFYRKVLNGEKRDDLQVLCWNCNLAKAKYGICPHEAGVREVKTRHG